MRKAKVYVDDIWAGTLSETENGYQYAYRADYVDRADAASVSVTLPLSDKLYESKILFPFFDGLIPEGWLLDIVEKNWKLNERDRMGILLVACHDCIGAVSIHPHEDEI